MTTVLVVDDEPDLRLVARMILQQAGHEVHEAATGEAALQLLDDGLRPDVVLLDVRMPGIDGWEVLRRIHRDPGTFNSTPVVVLTAYFASADEAPMEFGEHEYFLRKPYEADQLLGMVAAATEASPQH